ncbi:hypothetical protein ACGRSR_10765 [Vibrio owensii]|uniref:hypothetical protein n=1 Tax=Vibrio owensii TaxID=696485 RepID=UPI003749B032
MLNNKKLTALTTAITLMCMSGSLAAQEVKQQLSEPQAQQQDAENATVFKRVVPFSQLGYSGSIAIQGSEANAYVGFGSRLDDSSKPLT